MKRLAAQLRATFPTPKSLLRHRNWVEKTPTQVRWRVKQPIPNCSSENFLLPGTHGKVNARLELDDGKLRLWTTGGGSSSSSSCSSSAAAAAVRIIVNGETVGTTEGAKNAGNSNHHHRGGSQLTEVDCDSTEELDVVVEEAAAKADAAAFQSTAASGSAATATTAEGPPGAGASDSSGSRSSAAASPATSMLQTVQVMGELSAVWTVRFPDKECHTFRDMFPLPTPTPGGTNAASSTWKDMQGPESAASLVSTPFRLFHVHLGDFWFEFQPHFPHRDFGTVFFRLGYPGLSVRAEVSVGEEFKKTVVVTGRSSLEEDVAADACLSVNFERLWHVDQGNKRQLEVRVRLLEIIKVPPKLQDLAGGNGR